MEQTAHTAYASPRYETLGEGQAIYVEPFSSTRFSLAVEPEDYAEANAMFVLNGLPEEELIFPTVLARREGELVGVMGTREVQDCVLAGPLSLLPGVRRPILALRLLQEYERHLRRLGLTEVIFDLEIGSAMYRAVTYMMPDMIERGNNGKIAWFAWNLNAFTLIGDDNG